MTRPDPPDHADSRAVLIGVSAYEDAAFPSIRAARNSLEAMRATLTDPALCGWPEDRVTTILNPASVLGLVQQLSRVAKEATDTLLVYYVGHGLLVEGRDLNLTLTSTTADHPDITGLAWSKVAQVLKRSPAAMQAVILDCCFAGHAIESLAVGDDKILADTARVEGVYTLTATMRNRTAHVPASDDLDTVRTSFTGELCELVRDGIADEAEWLTFGAIYPALRRRLEAKGLPLPYQRGTDTAAKFRFTANNAYRSVATSSSQRPPRETQVATPFPEDTSVDARPTPQDARLRADKAFGTAISAAYAIGEPVDRTIALTKIARALLSHDLRRAMPLLADAEQTARDIGEVTQALRAVVRATVEFDPATAEELAAEFPEAEELLVDLVEELAPMDVAWAEQVASTILQPVHRLPAMVAVLREVARHDVNRAFSLATALIHEPLFDEWSLSALVAALADRTPNRAEMFVRQHTRGEPRARDLARLAQSWFPISRDQAARLFGEAQRTLQGMDHSPDRDHAALFLVTALADADPIRAVAVAGMIDDDDIYATALLRALVVLVRTDLVRARRISRQRKGEAVETLAKAALVTAVAVHNPAVMERLDVWSGYHKYPLAQASIATALAVTSTLQAMRVVAEISDPALRARVEADCIRIIAATNPDHAERLAQIVEDDAARVEAFCIVAEAWLTFA